MILRMKEAVMFCRKSVPQLMWGKDELHRVSGPGRDEKGVRHGLGGASSINTAPLISSNLWGGWTYSTASFYTFYGSC